MDDSYRIQFPGPGVTQPVTPSVNPQGQANRPAATPGTGETSFADTLAEVQGVRFSNHAKNRMEHRNINLGDDGLTRLAQAVDKAEKRGGNASLVLVDDLAFIVNVRERLVVTALDTDHRGDGVFTQIDSVVFADPASTAAETNDNGITA